MSSFSENIKATGVFDLTVLDASGKIVEHYQDNNLVVGGGRDALAKLLGAGTSGKVLSKICFGTNGADPVLSDSAITDSFELSFTSVTYPATNAVALGFELGLTQNNGVTIAEFGLKCVDGTVFARKSRAGIAKTNQIRLVGVWTITFN